MTTNSNTYNNIVWTMKVQACLDMHKLEQCMNACQDENEIAHMMELWHAAHEVERLVNAEAKRLAKLGAWFA